MKNRLYPILFGGDGGGSAVADAGLLLLRLFAGLALAFAHGVNKMPPSEGFVTSVGELGYPAPGFFAWAAGFSEFLGGLLLALGLLTRPASLFIAVVMATAAFGRHADDPFSVKEKPLLFLAVVLMFLLAGSGRYGLDRLIYRKRDDRIWR
ncbi:MAG TPA: DoxX family protein [Rubricoccaceae bacterium]|nr:DoxX family protein [Rubricoccaceae bacterium]